MKRKWQHIFAFIKLVFAYILTLLFFRRLKDKNLWLISEKLTEARDNGYHFFVYLRKNHPEVNAFYVIEKSSADLHKVETYGNIIYANTIMHYVYYLSALFSISSQPLGAAPEPKRVTARYHTLVEKRQHTIFLQHGVIQNGLPHGFDYSSTHYSLFVCSSSKEMEYVEKTYHYPKGIVQNLGLCRFDYLHTIPFKKKRIVLVMPTFRSWLVSKNIPREAYDSEKKSFISSDYYIAYNELLRNTHLQDYLRNKGYKLVFYPHYAMQPFIKCFKECETDVVTIADRFHYDVQKLLIESSCLITDYSSVFFDFAYMNKPVIYYQYDEMKFRSNHYKKGYFDYKIDGFGPVFDKADQVIAYLAGCIDNECKLEEIYYDRVESFFDRRDDHNCERTYQAIMKIRG